MKALFGAEPHDPGRVSEEEVNVNPRGNSMQKKALAVAIASAVAVPLTANAVTSKISGHINRAIRWIDDGQGSEIQHFDNGNSRTRFRWVGSEKFGSGMSAGIYLEIAMASNKSTSLASKFQRDGDGGDSFGGGATVSDATAGPAGGENDLRHAAIWFKGGWGKVTLGHTSEATDVIQYNDFSGTGLADLSAVTPEFNVTFRTTGGGCPTKAGGTQAAFSAACIKVHDVFGTFDGSRLDNIRYNSPKFGPLSFAVSSANNSRWAYRLNLASAIAGGKFKGSVGFTDKGSGSAGDIIHWSASYLFSQGTSITVAGTDVNDAGGDQAFYWYTKLAHKWGNNAISASYATHTDQGGADYDGQVIGVGFVHKIPKPGIELYAGYRNYSVDEVAGQGGSIEDLNSVVVGSRIKFN